ncbi:MAG: hypothetical protein ACTSO9_21620 [Candidatus Helarchaeota archaeon]
METLNLKGNKISSLPKEILNCKNLRFLALEGNPLGLPAHIQRMNTSPFRILEYYIEQLDNKKRKKRRKNLKAKNINKFNQ